MSYELFRKIEDPHRIPPPTPQLTPKKSSDDSEFSINFSPKRRFGALKY